MLANTFFRRILLTQRNIGSLQSLSVSGRAVGTGRYADYFFFFLQNGGSGIAAEAVHCP